jgi:hypothetical protein
MKALAQLPSDFFSGTALALVAIVAMISGISCSQPQTPQVIPPPGKTKAYTCKDRPIDIDKSYSHGVKQETVVVCGGNNVSWKGPAHWEVRFTTSPFVSGVTVITDTSLDPGPVIQEPADQDTAFKYAVTTNDGVKHDPQIIIMGGGS